MMRIILINLVILTIFGCTNEQLQRMVEQRRFRPYSETDFFEDRRAMRTPPPGTVSLEQGREGGQASGTELAAVAKPISLAMLRLGQREFQVTCAACHGLLGDGKSVVADKMALRAPPSIHDFADRPDRFFYGVITDGYGLMPAFSEHIDSDRRWAVVAYIRALQRSQHARLSDAPPPVQAQLLRESR